MLDIARSYPSPRATLRPLSIYTMLLLAYCAGLRRGELARLDLGDVNPGDGTITVRQTKFFKTRILPLPDSVMMELRAYIAARRQVGASQDPHSALFWHVQGRSRYTPEMITWLLTDVVRRAGLKPLQGQFGPRVHDCQRRSKSRPFGGVKPGHRVTCRGEWREGVARGPLPPALV
ncbi:tyrosine-type recombinase/integrase [Sphingopyxis sp. LC363]|uniref:tyrosine-type recombinase/integrase n=1 Tax=Sphingopyxis sp. LC363 TaxID=1120705 RepID=UPI001F23AEBF|nr:tyrosine-type recombinase/integrase [Sphingopyxis sp. LC363]